MRRHYLMNPLWRCQLKCSYCWVIRHVRRHPVLDGIPERSLEDWVRAIWRDPPDVMDIGGGEPLLLPWIMDLIDAFPLVRWGLSTNGLCAGRIEELAERRPRNLVNVNLSYHPEAARTVPGYDEQWKRQVLLLAKVGLPVGPNLEKTPYNLKYGQWAVAWLRSQGLHMVVSPLCGGREESHHLQEEAMVCEAGRASLVLGPDGTAWPCLSALWSDWWAETVLGNWIDGTVDRSRVQQPCHLYCAEYHVQYGEHESGDFWGTRVRPAERRAKE